MILSPRLLVSRNMGNGREIMRSAHGVSIAIVHFFHAWKRSKSRLLPLDVLRLRSRPCFSANRAAIFLSLLPLSVSLCFSYPIVSTMHKYIYIYISIFFHTELSFPIIPHEIYILPPFPGLPTGERRGERERESEWRAHTRARKAARNLNGFRG